MSYIFTTPELGGRIVYQDEKYEMNEAGEERVAFNAEEWAAMMSDPSFGYVCRNGHRIDQAYASGMGGCRRCDYLAEMAEVEYYEELAAAEAQEAAAEVAYEAPSLPDFSPDDAPF